MQLSATKHDVSKTLELLWTQLGLERREDLEPSQEIAQIEICRNAWKTIADTSLGSDAPETSYHT
jgi:hypothetical protein